MPTRAPRGSASRRSDTRATDQGEPAPRLPHERDQSSDSVAAEPTDVMRQAHADLADGMVDTDRGVPADAAYRKQKKPAAVPRKPRR